MFHKPTKNDFSVNICIDCTHILCEYYLYNFNCIYNREYSISKVFKAIKSALVAM